MPTPSMGTGPLLPERWNTARQVGAGMTGSRWIPRVTRLGTWTRIRSMRSACCSPDRGRVALALPGQLSGQEQSVPVSTGALGLVVTAFLGVDLQRCVYQVLSPASPALTASSAGTNNSLRPGTVTQQDFGTSRLGISQQPPPPFFSFFAFVF